jgi:hypothetical protein
MTVSCGDVAPTCARLRRIQQWPAVHLGRSPALEWSYRMVYGYASCNGIDDSLKGNRFLAPDGWVEGGGREGGYVWWCGDGEGEC